jgi:purine-cytosine permease-like protein
MALQSDRLALGIIALVLIALSAMYGIFVMRAPLQILSALLPLVFLYLVWRFVVAHERIADALETGGGSEKTDAE